MSSNDYGTYKPPKSPKSPRAARQDPPTGSRNSSRPAVPPPVPPVGSRKSGRAADEAPRSPRSPRSPRVTPVVAPAASWGGSDSSRYEPLVGNDDENDSGCPNCGTVNRPKAKFCDACAFSLRGQNKAAALFDTSDWEFNPGRYGLFGWLETILGVISLAMGFASLNAYQNPGVPMTSHRTAQAVMIGLMLVVFVLLTVQRFFYKELFAFIYAALSMGGAICAMIVVMLHSRRPGTFFVVYFFAYALAMAVKMFWLCCDDLGPTSSFKLETHLILDSKLKILLVTIALCLFTSIGFIVQLLILTTTFEEQ